MSIPLLPASLHKCLLYAFAVVFIVVMCSATDNTTHSDAKAGDKAGLQTEKRRLFLIAVIDSTDEIIGKRCAEDMDGILDEFEYVAKKIKAQWVEPNIIAGDRYGKAAVNDAIDNWLKNQQPSENDIVVFYYSGHGYREATDKSEFPRMWLKTATDRDVKTNNLRMEEDVYDRIVKMGAGINIVMSDCCNNTIVDANASVENVTVPTRKRVHSGEPDDEEDNGHKLFAAGEPLSILVTAASKGELASGKDEDGGFFTAFFLDDLDYVMSNNGGEASWEAIFKYADENASDLAKAAVCPVSAVHSTQGRCVQTVKVKMEGGDQ